MVTNELSIPAPTHFPIDLGRHGLNPHSGPLYRCVLAQSVFTIAALRWKDGKHGYRLVRSYPNIDGWIVERWISPMMYTGMSEAMYEVEKKDPLTGLFRMGAYPRKGEYWMVGDDPLKNPGDGGLERFIRQAEWCYQHPNPSAVEVAVFEEGLRKEAEADEFMLQTIKECRPSFGMRPTSFAGHVHSNKAKASQVSATKLNLPVKHGMHVLGGR